MLKIITGSVKGRALRSLEGEATRPTSERIKEAIFSSIQFDIEGRRVLDLFAGSGQMGLEALSRGAASCMFIDSSREAMDIVRANISACGFESNTKYLVSDAKNYVRKASGKAVYDLVFIDPPYAMQCAGEILRRLCEGGVLANGAIAVLECGEEAPDLSGIAGLTLDKEKHYGKKTSVYVYTYVKEASV